MYSSNAERQAAYRDRLNQRQALAESGQLVARLVELETALAAANRRAEVAEARAVRAERDATTARDRYAELLATRPARVAGAPGWAKNRMADQLAPTPLLTPRPRRGSTAPHGEPRSATGADTGIDLG
jgi:uncharacterized protein involved in exopolysaccharide biosynthesis